MDQSERIDVNCLWGHWPFRHIPRARFADLVHDHTACGIRQGYIASLNSIFYVDPLEGEAELYEQVKGSAYRQVLTVNPLHQACQDIQFGIEHYQVAAVRIYPGYHGYRLLDPKVRVLLDFIGERSLPLFLPLRMEDERLDHLVQPRPVDLAELEGFLSVNPTRTIVLLNVRLAEIERLKPLIRTGQRIYVDTSGLKDQLFSVEKAVDAIGAGHILYGSLSPLYCLRSTVLSVALSALSPEQKQAIWSSNAAVMAAPKQQKHTLDHPFG